MVVDPSAPAANPAPADSAAPATDPPAKKPLKKKTNKTPITVDRFHSGIPEATIVQYKDQERRMKDEDHIARETADRKNELESLVYTWRDRLASAYADYVTAEVRDKRIALCLQNIKVIRSGSTAKAATQSKASTSNKLVTSRKKSTRSTDALPPFSISQRQRKASTRSLQRS